jgi:tetratricopeptide (TPR) repeat protein
MRAVVVALVVACSGAAARADAPGEARAHYQRGLALYNEGRFAAARGEFEAGHQLQPLPLFLFNEAQAARRDGDEKGALALYRQFVAADPQSAERAEAEARIAELSAKAPAPSADARTPPAVAASPPVVAAPSLRAPARHDVADTALLTIGATGAAAGAVLLGIGGARLADAQSSYASYDDAQHATPLVASGAVLLGVGGVLVITGAIRYDLVKRRHRQK